jgi:hypothetical protein
MEHDQFPPTQLLAVVQYRFPAWTLSALPVPLVQFYPRMLAEVHCLSSFFLQPVEYGNSGPRIYNTREAVKAILETLLTINMVHPYQGHFFTVKGNTITFISLFHHYDTE